MLETVREFAHDRLAESGELDELRRRHAEHMLALAERGRPLARGPEEPELIAQLVVDLDNFRAGVRVRTGGGRRGTRHHHRRGARAPLDPGHATARGDSLARTAPSPRRRGRSGHSRRRAHAGRALGDRGRRDRAGRAVVASRARARPGCRRRSAACVGSPRRRPPLGRAGQPQGSRGPPRGEHGALSRARRPCAGRRAHDLPRPLRRA